MTSSRCGCAYISASESGVEDVYAHYPVKVLQCPSSVGYQHSNIYIVTYGGQ